MVDYLKGKLVRVHPEAVVVELGGIGLRVQVSPELAASLPAPGENVRLFTHLVVREDAFELFGFTEELDRTAYLQLLEVAGIGPRTALAAVGRLGARRLLTAILREDTTLLTTVPGIGVKTARRIVVELRDRIEKQQLVAVGDGRVHDTTAQSEALAALISLGYSSREAGEALSRVNDRDAEAAGLVSSALRILGG
ncbi:MAG: Holliday junction branch migration protein RuvA [Candidatus Desulforudis sp.]|nr:Holliday junction branch migration protein RuvA [Desulforudis sp.]